MRFVDEVCIEVQSGHGGAGCIAFRREKYIPRGGPNGGDGGRGGHVIVVASRDQQTLLNLYYRKHLLAKNGLPGMGSNRHGKDGADILVQVPVGTVIKDEDGEQLADLDHEGARFFLARGGQGGLGNSHFATSTHQTPRYAQPGEEGEGGKRILELKSMADVGLVGFPNAGKSTLLSRISNARPKIADYPFTTLAPALGLVRMADADGFVVADIPGLIEGAHQGRGLGDRFLRHIERTRLLIHLADAASLDSRTVAMQVRDIETELRKYSPELFQKPRFLVINKIDALSEAEIQQARDGITDSPLPVFCISAVTGQGVDRLLFAIYEQLQKMRNSEKGAADPALRTGS